MSNLIKESWYEILITTIYIINFLSIINLIFREKRSIEATVAWVLVLTTAPAIGCIIYLAFGRGVSKNNMFKINSIFLTNNLLKYLFSSVYNVETSQSQLWFVYLKIVFKNCISLNIFKI